MTAGETPATKMDAGMSSGATGGGAGAPPAPDGPDAPV